MNLPHSICSSCGCKLTILWPIGNHWELRCMRCDVAEVVS